LHSLIGTDAFQEVNTYGLTFPIAKHSYLVKMPRTPSGYGKRIRVAVSGRPGPVVIDVPKDIQNQEVELADSEIKISHKTPEPDIRS
jgi:acetolactate synthase-1/2/3 large subunit